MDNALAVVARAPPRRAAFHTMDGDGVHPPVPVHFALVEIHPDKGAIGENQRIGFSVRETQGADLSLGKGELLGKPCVDDTDDFCFDASGASDLQTKDRLTV